LKELSVDAMRTTSGMTRRQVMQWLGLAPFAASAAHRSFALPAVVKSGIDLVSNDQQLTNAFRWAKKQALGYVFDGDPVGPWYEAALPGREAFCMRDTAHQADGAQALGLGRWNHNMLRRFAEKIAESRDWCSYWEIDKLNRPAPVDYKSDKQFWYNLPANYDVLDACYRMFLWTGDRRYIDDPVFLNFYDRTIHEYTERWSLSPQRIMERTSNIEEPPFFRGDPTYEESSRDNLIGIDLLATQYAAFRDYAAIQSLRGESRASQEALRTAEEIRTLINTRWWNASEEYFYAFYTKQHKFTGRAGADVLYHDAADRGPKTASALETLLATIRTEPSDAVEAKSHYAEILYRYGKIDAAYRQILDLSREGRVRREYPEVSYSIIGALVTGLMGISVEPEPPVLARSAAAFAPVVVTRPSLNSANDWVELRNVPLFDGSVSIRHQGNNQTFFTNHGKARLRWKPEFSGSFQSLRIYGKPTHAGIASSLSGPILAGAPITVAPGSTLRVDAQ